MASPETRRTRRSQNTWLLGLDSFSASVQCLAQGAADLESGFFKDFGGFYLSVSEVEMMKLVVPGWARPRQMVGKQASKYKLFATEGEPCLFKHVSPRDIEQGHLAQLASCRVRSRLTGSFLLCS